jgi:hypothetical protein
MGATPRVAGVAGPEVLANEQARILYDAIIMAAEQVGLDGKHGSPSGEHGQGGASQSCIGDSLMLARSFCSSTNKRLKSTSSKEPCFKTFAGRDTMPRCQRSCWLR